MTTQEKEQNAMDKIRNNSEVITFLAEKMDTRYISVHATQHLLQLVSDDIWDALAVFDDTEP